MMRFSTLSPLNGHFKFLATVDLYHQTSHRPLRLFLSKANQETTTFPVPFSLMRLFDGHRRGQFVPSASVCRHHSADECSAQQQFLCLFLSRTDRGVENFLCEPRNQLAFLRGLRFGLSRIVVDRSVRSRFLEPTGNRVFRRRIIQQYPVVFGIGSIQ